MGIVHYNDNAAEVFLVALYVGSYTRIINSNWIVNGDHNE